jgi:RepB DNA-primase from phage plasmid
MIGDQAAPADAATATRVAKYLASTYSGDLRSAKADQLGRLPGLRNRKPKHQQGNGCYPLVMVRRAVWTSPQRVAIERAFNTPLPPSPRSASALDFSTEKIMQTPITEQEARELWNEAQNELVRRFGPFPSNDRSAVDYHVARHFALNGIEPEVAAKIIALNSEKAHERGVDYVNATIAGAYRSKTK